MMTIMSSLKALDVDIRTSSGASDDKIVKITTLFSVDRWDASIAAWKMPQMRMIAVALYLSGPWEKGCPLKTPFRHILWLTLRALNKWCILCYILLMIKKHWLLCHQVISHYLNQPWPYPMLYCCGILGRMGIMSAGKNISLLFDFIWQH